MCNSQMTDPQYASIENWLKKQGEIYEFTIIVGDVNTPLRNRLIH